MFENAPIERINLIQKEREWEIAREKEREREGYRL